MTTTIVQGATIAIGLDALPPPGETTGPDLSAVTGVTAWLSRRPRASNVPVSLTVTARASDAEVPGWNLTLTDTRSLPPGEYRLFARVMFGDVAVVTEPPLALTIAPA
jgi:hypothetical protein